MKRVCEYELPFASTSDFYRLSSKRILMIVYSVA